MYLRLQLATLPGISVLTPAQPSLWCAILSFRVPNRDHATLARALAIEDRIVVRHVQHSAAFDALRVSVHAYNDHADIDRLVNALRRRI